MIISKDGERSGSSMERDEENSSSQHMTETPAKGPRTLKGEQISPQKRLIAASILSLMCFATTFSSSAYASSALSIQKHFQASQDVVLLGIALFVLGFALGPLLFGPLSFVIGKRPVYIITFVSFTGELISMPKTRYYLLIAIPLHGLQHFRSVQQNHKILKR